MHLKARGTGRPTIDVICKATVCPDPWFGIGAVVYGYLLILFMRVDSRFFESTPRVSRPSRRAFRSALRALVECNLRREGKEDPWSTGTSQLFTRVDSTFFESTPRVYGGFYRRTQRIQKQRSSRRRMKNPMFHRSLCACWGQFWPGCESETHKQIQSNEAESLNKSWTENSK